MKIVERTARGIRRNSPRSGLLIGGVGAATVLMFAVVPSAARADHYSTFQNCFGEVTKDPGTVGCEGSLSGADDGYQQTGAWRTPSRYMPIAERGLQSATVTALQAVVSNYFNDTNLFPQLNMDESACTANEFSHCVYDDYYGTDHPFRGWNSCNQGSTRSGLNPNRVCGTQSIKVNLSYTDTSRKKTLCHEFGHGIGFRHSGEAQNISCMHNSTGAGLQEKLSNKDIGEINFRYPLSMS